MLYSGVDYSVIQILVLYAGTNVFAYSLIQSAFSVCGLDSLSRTEFVDCDLKILLFTMHFLLRS